MSSAPSPPYSPLRPEFPGTGYERVGTAEFRSDTPMTPISLITGSCRNILSPSSILGDIKVVDLIVTTRLAASGVAGVRNLDLNFSFDVTCAPSAVGIYPYNTKVNEVAGHAPSDTLLEITQHLHINLGVVPPGATGFYLSWTGDTGGHALWYAVAGLTLDR